MAVGWAKLKDAVERAENWVRVFDEWVSANPREADDMGFDIYSELHAAAKILAAVRDGVADAFRLPAKPLAEVLKERRPVIGATYRNSVSGREYTVVGTATALAYTRTGKQDVDDSFASPETEYVVLRLEDNLLPGRIVRLREKTGRSDLVLYSLKDFNAVSPADAGRAWLEHVEPAVKEFPLTECPPLKGTFGGPVVVHGVYRQGDVAYVDFADGASRHTYPLSVFSQLYDPKGADAAITAAQDRVIHRAARTVHTILKIDEHGVWLSPGDGAITPHRLFNEYAPYQSGRG